MRGGRAPAASPPPSPTGPSPSARPGARPELSSKFGMILDWPFSCNCQSKPTAREAQECGSEVTDIPASQTSPAPALMRPLLALPFTAALALHSEATAQQAQAEQRGRACTRARPPGSTPGLDGGCEAQLPRLPLGQQRCMRPQYAPHRRPARDTEGGGPPRDSALQNLRNTGVCGRPCPWKCSSAGAGTTRWHDQSRVGTQPTRAHRSSLHGYVCRVQGCQALAWAPYSCVPLEDPQTLKSARQLYGNLALLAA